MPEHTIAENLSRLITAKTDIANAITTMGGVVGENDGFEEFPSDILGIPSGQSLHPVTLATRIIRSNYCSAATVDLALYDGEWLILVFRCDIIAAYNNEGEIEYARCFLPDNTSYGSFVIYRVMHTDGTIFPSNAGVSATLGDGYISLRHYYGFNSPTTTALVKACIQLVQS